MFDTSDCHINQSAVGFTLPDWFVSAVVVPAAAPVLTSVGRKYTWKFQSTGLIAVLKRCCERSGFVPDSSEVISCVAADDVTANPANTSSFQVLEGVIAVTAAPLIKSMVEKNTSEFLCRLRDAMSFSLVF